CEEITVAEVRQVLAAGVHNPDNIKTLTRVGMGRCQGRMCGGALTHLIAMQSGLKVEDIGYLKPRPPVIPITLENLLEEEVRHVS
ncbi:MAG: (2Fe-2S)-binding protein, partial [Anaerolineaceae bacterium]|nr:(2Fe-2S)-binding protein [Anaerolineaceae bacterium]